MTILDKYRHYADLGYTKAEAAAAMGVNRASVSRYAARHGIAFSKHVRIGRPRKADPTRPFNPVFSCSPEAVAKYLAANP